MTDATTDIISEPNIECNAATPDEHFAMEKKLFLRNLSVSGDITAAAKAAGHDDDVVFFQERQASVAFYAEWDAAMDTAYLRLESVLVASALKEATKPADETNSPTDLRVLATWHRLGLNLLAARRLMLRQTQGRTQGRTLGRTLGRTMGQTLGQPQNLAGNNRSALLSRLKMMRERDDNKSTHMASNE